MQHLHFAQEALRHLSARITAIVTMMDSGGSSGRLRDEYGLLPPGDFTRCLVALSCLVAASCAELKDQPNEDEIAIAEAAGAKYAEPVL